MALLRGALPLRISHSDDQRRPRWLGESNAGCSEWPK